MKRTTCRGCPALNGDGTCTIIAEGRKITITPDMEQGCCAAPDDDGKEQVIRVNPPVLKTIYETPEECPNCMEHLSLDWAYCPECGRPTDWYKPKPLTLEQLKNMVGQPVWIESDRAKEWCLLWKCHGPEIYGRSAIFTKKTSQKLQYLFSDYGKTWLAYKDRPKEEKWMKYPGHKFCGACGALMDGGQGND